jgi:uncharacterized protein (DUF2336 family)
VRKAADIFEQARNRRTEAAGELARVIDDAFIPDSHRMNEMDRARFVDILGKLVFTIEMDVRLNLIDALASAGERDTELEQYLADDHIELARADLVFHPALRDRNLLALVKSRCDEYHLGRALLHGRENTTRTEPDAAKSDIIENLLRHADGPIAKRAMEYLVAETRRTDRFDEPVISRQDVPNALLERLHWLIAAALKASLQAKFTLGEPLLDHALENAVGRALAEIDENQGAHVRAARLAQQLHAAGDVTDAFLLRCLRQSRLLLLSAGLAARGHIPLSNISPLLLDRSLVSTTALLRALDVARPIASAILYELSEALNLRGVALRYPMSELITQFDEARPDSISKSLHHWQRSIKYQAAIDDLAGFNG